MIKSPFSKRIPKDFKILMFYPNLHMSALMPQSIGIFAALFKREGYTIDLFDCTYYKDIDSLTLGRNTNEEKVENILGRATVQESFKIPKIGFIAGSKVLEGSIVRNGQARVIRDEEQIADGEVTSLKHLKDDVKEIKEGFECGIGIDTFSKFKEGKG